MPTIDQTTGDVRAQHQAAVAHVKMCQDRVRELNGALVTEKHVLVDQRRELKRVRPDGTEAPPGERSITWGVIVSNEVTGSKVVPNDVDAITRWRAKLDYPQAVEQLRRAELDEMVLRQQVAELDAAERHREKLRRLPAVRDAYAKLDAALVKAAALRGAVLDAIARVGEVSPTDATLSAGFGWAELNLIDHRREMVRSWTSQGNGNGSA